MDNIDWADLTIVVSNSEYNKIVGVNEELGRKVKVFGFPIDFSRLRKFKGRKKKKGSVCFLGETRAIKNPEFEVALIQFLSSKEYKCFHLSPSFVSYKDRLLSSGCRVVEGVRGERYFSLLSKFEFFISTSHYESLSVSGIEAFLLGCVPFVPDHSGFIDWCPPENRYRVFKKEIIFETMLKAREDSDKEVDLSWYSADNFFRRLENELVVRSGRQGP